MVESYVTLKRKDYVKILELLDSIDKDVHLYKNKDNEELIKSAENKLSVIQNILAEDY